MRTKTVIPPNNLEELRKARGLTMEAVAEAIGTDPSTINKLEKRKTNLSSERILKLAAFYSVSPSEIIQTESDAHHLPPREEVSPIPVLGVAAGSLLKGSAQLTSGPVDSIPRPRGLEFSQDIYALYVDGTSMEPMFRHGSPIIVNPHKPVRIGDAVIVQERHGPHNQVLASIGILESRTGREIVLTKINPVGRLTIKAEYVENIHKVLDYSDLIALL